MTISHLSTPRGFHKFEVTLRSLRAKGQQIQGPPPATAGGTGTLGLDEAVGTSCGHAQCHVWKLPRVPEGAWGRVRGQEQEVGTLALS